jgi:hypothetical protein
MRLGGRRFGGDRLEYALGFAMRWFGSFLVGSLLRPRLALGTVLSSLAVLLRRGACFSRCALAG